MRARHGIRALLGALSLLYLPAGAATGVHLASAPPGASVLVDGEDTGFATPCTLDLDFDDRLDIDFVLPGFTTARRTIFDDSRAYVIYWREMLISHNTWRFPLWLNVEDGFLPVKTYFGKSPNRLFVRLRREADR